MVRIDHDGSRFKILRRWTSSLRLGSKSKPPTPTSALEDDCEKKDPPIRCFSPMSTPSSGASLTKRKSVGGEPLIVFDWDDTLCPTYFVKSRILQSPTITSAPSLEALRNRDLYEDVLAGHTQVVIEVLRAARRVGRVVIITLAQQAWMEMSLKYYMSEELRDVFRELDIEIFYAEMPKFAIRGEYPGVTAKKRAFLNCIKKFHDGGVMNVTSVGDSVTEQIAVKEVMASQLSAAGDRACKIMHDSAADRICKTMKLRENPLVSQLTGDLKCLIPSLPRLAAHQEDFDCDGPVF